MNSSIFTRCHRVSMSFRFATSLIACGAFAAVSNMATAQLPAGIQPLTTVNGTTGYFSDPLPIHRAMADGSYIPSLSGTKLKILACSSLAAQCYTSSALSVTMNAALTSQVNASGSTITGYENYNVYQLNAGGWHMAVTAFITDGTNKWHIVLHASPASGSPTDPSGVPLSWVDDTLILGHLTYTNASTDGGNYDGKYIEDNGNLYLIYSKLVVAGANGQMGLAAQQMTSPTAVNTSVAPVVLLAPQTNSDNGYNSELLECQSTTDTFKLMETGNIAKVQGKYVLAYSTGSFDNVCYKSGLAWSDNLLGPYKKVLHPDPTNIWANPINEPEVLYIVQALQSAWPNYVKSTAQSPGVPSLVQYPAGTWYLYFAGYDPSINPDSTGTYDGSKRQPYVMKLTVAIPANTTVKETKNQDLSTWITAAQ